MASTIYVSIQSPCVLPGSVLGPSDAGKMIPESGFLLFTQSKSELHEHTGSKQAKSLLQESKQLPGLLGGREKSPALYCPIGIVSLKDGGEPTWLGGVTNMGSIGLAQLPMSVLVQYPIGVLGVEMSHKFSGFFVFLFP